MNLEDFNPEFFNLKGKVAVVTGAATGLGQAFAVALAKSGVKIVAVAHRSDWGETEKLLTKCQTETLYLQADLSHKKAAKEVIEKAVERFGQVDILVNNAGTIRRAPLLEYADEDWEAVINLNLNAVYYISQSAAKVMAKQKGGKIINIASMLSFQGGKFVPPYTASKHGVVGLTKAFANELSEFNIQVNAIAPGYIATNNTAAIRSDEKRSAEILNRIPAQRWGTPADLMGAVVFLASSASNYVTGHTLAVDGGWLVR